MTKKIALLAALIATAVFAFTLAPANADSPQDQFAQQAAALLAAVPVVYVGADWGPVPIYRVVLDGQTIDVAAVSASAARADPVVLSIITRSLWEAAGSPPAPVTTTVVVGQSVVAPSTTTTSVTTTTEAAPSVPAPEPVVTTTTVAPAATVDTTVVAAAPVGIVYATRQVTVPDASAPLGEILTRTLHTPVTFTRTVVFSLHGHKTTKKAVVQALRVSHSATLTMRPLANGFMVVRLSVA